MYHLYHMINIPKQISMRVQGGLLQVTSEQDNLFLRHYNTSKLNCYHLTKRHYIYGIIKKGAIYVLFPLSMRGRAGKFCSGAYKSDISPTTILVQSGLRWPIGESVGFKIGMTILSASSIPAGGYSFESLRFSVNR